MLKVLGCIVLVAGLAVAGADIVSWRQGGEVRLSALGEWWFWAHKDSLQVLQPAIERHLSPALWDPGVQTLLEWPLAVELVVLALVLLAVSALLRLRRGKAA